MILGIYRTTYVTQGKEWRKENNILDEALAEPMGAFRDAKSSASINTI